VLGFYDRVLTSDMTNWLRAIGTGTDIPAISPFLASIDLTNYKFGIFGLALVILMVTRPEGIFPNRQRAAELHADTDELEQLGEEALVDRTVGGVRA